MTTVTPTEGDDSQANSRQRGHARRRRTAAATMRDVAERPGVHRHRLARGQQQAGRPHRRGHARARASTRSRSSATGRTPWRKNLVSGHVRSSSGWSPTPSPPRRSPARSSTARRTRPGSTATCCWSRTPRATARPRTRRIAMMLEHQVRGILYSTWYHRAAEIPPALRETRRRARQLLLREPARRRAVVPDEVQGGRTATESCSSPRPPSHRVHQHHHPRARARRPAAGVPRGTRGSRHPVRRAPRARCAPRPGGRLRRRRADSLDRGATAVFCYNDRVAMGLYDGLRERGLSIPDDMSRSSASTTRRSSPPTFGRR